MGRHMVMPTPTAAPLIAATIGFRQLKIASVIESLASRFCGLLPSFHTWKAPLPPEMSAPAQKARPAPVTTMARTSSIAFTCWKKSISSRLIDRVEGVELVGPVERHGHHAVGKIGQQGLVFHGHYRSSRIVPPSEAECRCATARFGKHSPQRQAIRNPGGSRCLTC